MNYTNQLPVNLRNLKCTLLLKIAFGAEDLDDMQLISK